MDMEVRFEIPSSIVCCETYVNCAPISCRSTAEPPGRATYRPPASQIAKSTEGRRDSSASQIDADRDHRAEADDFLAQLLL